jgi:hypothetical protein
MHHINRITAKAHKPKQAIASMIRFIAGPESDGASVRTSPGRSLGRDDKAAGSISQELCGGGVCHDGWDIMLD